MKQVKVLFVVIQFDQCFLFKVSAFKTYEVASLKRANTEKSADILVGVLKETRDVGKVYHEIIQKCTQLDSK